MLDSVATHTKSLNGGTMFLNSEPANSPVKPASRSKKLIPLATANRIPLSSGGCKATPRSATPTGKTSLPAKCKSFHPSTTNFKSDKTCCCSREFSHSCKTCINQFKVLNKVCNTNSGTIYQAMTSIASAKDQFSRGRKTGPVVSHGTSTFLKTKPSKPSVMRTSSHDTQSSKILMPKRAASASRGRPSVPNTISLNADSRQKACSPSIERAPNGTHHKSESVIRNRSRHATGGDEVNPVLLGSKMVERVVNMRKLAPPKQAEYSSHYAQKSFHGSLGFGRSLSKKSLDMAIRHMDIRGSISDNIRSCPLATGDVTTLLGTKSCYSMDSTVDTAESPLATSRY